jgi:hypothetical protein
MPAAKDARKIISRNFMAWRGKLKQILSKLAHAGARTVLASCGEAGDNFRRRAAAMHRAAVIFARFRNADDADIPDLRGSVRGC